MESQFISELESVGSVAETLEHKPVRYEQEYHGSKITVVEFDHQQSRLAGKEYFFPKDWREKLDKEFDNTGDSIALEYCMPDLWKNARFELLAVGYDKGQDKNEKDHTTEVYGYLGRLAGQQGKELVAADPANEGVYVIFEGGGGAENPFALPSPASLTQHVLGNIKYGPGTFSYFEYGNINNREIDEGFIVDTRRLLTARGLIQEVLLKKQDVTLFTAPVHAERIANYVNRQQKFENDTQTKAERPKDLTTITPKEEARKMITYGRWPLHRNVRVYTPLLSPNSFTFDLFLHDGTLAADEKKRDSKEYLQEAYNQMDNLLSHEPQTTKEKWYFKRVRTIKLILGTFLKTSITNSSICENIRKEIWSYLSTDRYGWTLSEKNKIY